MTTVSDGHSDQLSILLHTMLTGQASILPWTTSTSRPLTPKHPSLRFQNSKTKTTWPSTSSAEKRGNYPPPQQTPANMPRINLLLIEKAGKFHNTWIKDLNRLLYDQSKPREHKHFCERYLHGYSREDLMESHRPECRGISQTAVRVEILEEGENKLAFQYHHKQLPTPFTIYTDFEALTTKIEGPELNPMKSNTRETQHHEACSYCHIVVRCDGQTELPVEYRGPNAAEHFLEALKEKEGKINTVLANPNAMRMTQEDWRTHNSATTCHV